MDLRRPVALAVVVDGSEEDSPVRTIAVVYSPGLGGRWHVRNVGLNPGPSRRFVHLFIGEPAEDLISEVRRLGLPHHVVPFASRSDLPLAVLRTRKILRTHRVTTVHAHGMQGTTVGLLSALLAGIVERIHTRHHGSGNHDGIERRGLWYDRLNNRLSTRIIATSQTTRRCLVEFEGVAAERVRILGYRFEFDHFREVSPTRIDAVRQAHDIPGDRHVVGMISRFVDLKGIEYGIEAFRRYLNEVPHALLVLANAVGPHGPAIREALSTLPPDSHREVAFEPDAGALYGTFDLMLHLPVNETYEGWGQTYVEPLAAGVPLVCTRSGIANEAHVDGRHCLFVPFRDAEATHSAMVRIARDANLRQHLVDHGPEVIGRFSFDPSEDLLGPVYD